MPRFSALRIERNPFNYKEGPFIIIVCPMSSDPFYIVMKYKLGEDFMERQ